MTDAPARPEPELVAAEGPCGGPVFRYRGPREGGHVCTLPMKGKPLHGMTFGVVGTITPLMDLCGCRSGACRTTCPP
jgi:hypothetical protein